MRTLPYHDDVPSFGDWGFLLAWRGPERESALRPRIAALERFPVETRSLTPSVFRA